MKVVMSQWTTLHGGLWTTAEASLLLSSLSLERATHIGEGTFWEELSSKFNYVLNWGQLSFSGGGEKSGIQIS